MHRVKYSSVGSSLETNPNAARGRPRLTAFGRVIRRPMRQTGPNRTVRVSGLAKRGAAISSPGASFGLSTKAFSLRNGGVIYADYRVAAPGAARRRRSRGLRAGRGPGDVGTEFGAEQTRAIATRRGATKNKQTNKQTRENSNENKETAQCVRGCVRKEKWDEGREMNKGSRRGLGWGSTEDGLGSRDASGRRRRRRREGETANL